MKTCGDCPWAGSDVLRTEFSLGENPEGMTFCFVENCWKYRTNPECHVRKAFRVLRDEFRCLGKEWELATDVASRSQAETREKWRWRRAFETLRDEYKNLKALYTNDSFGIPRINNDP